MASAARKLTRLSWTVAVSVFSEEAICWNDGTYMLIDIGPESVTSPSTSAVRPRLYSAPATGVDGGASLADMATRLHAFAGSINAACRAASRGECNGSGDFGPQRSGLCF